LNFTGNNKELLLIHKEIKKPLATEAFNVMLTPRFYTLKKEILPIKYAYQAKRIAPSLFDGLLDAGRQYDYMVYKEADAWVFLAYDLEMIMDFLQSQGMDLELVSKLFFAQQAVEHLSKPVLLSDTEALLSLEGIATIVPRSALGAEVSPLVIDKVFTPKKGVVVQGSYGSILSLKQTAMFASVFLLFAMMFFVEGLRYGGDGGADEELQTLLASHSSLQSSYARESIMSKFETLDSAERKKRDSIKNLSEMIFKGVTLLSLKMEGKGFEARFSCKDAEIANRLKTLAQKYSYKTSAFTGSNDLKIEGAL
jgi:hypothetical protein